MLSFINPFFEVVKEGWNLQFGIVEDF